MSRIYALLLVSILLPACGQPVLTNIRPAAPVVAAVAPEGHAESARSIVRDSVTRFLAKKHPGMVIKRLTVTEAVQNGLRAFSAECISARQVRRLEGHYDVAKRIAGIETDTLLP